MPIRIVLADDHKIVRDSLRVLLEHDGRYEIAGEASNGREAVEVVEQNEPDIVIMDVGMPELNGIDATRIICKGDSGAKVVALSMHSDNRFVQQMLEAGASAYLLKDAVFHDLKQAIEQAMRGKVYVTQSANLSSKSRIKPRTSDEAADSIALLAPREREVLQLIAEGRTTKEIAAELDVSPKTIETHRQRIMEKLNIRSVAGLTKYALRQGLTALE